MTSSNGNIFRVTGPLCGEFTGPFTGPGEFPAQRPVMRSFDVFFDLRLNKPLSKQWGWWFETPPWSLWRQCNETRVADEHHLLFDPPIMTTFHYSSMYSALPISRGHFTPYNSRKTPIARPLGRGMGVFRESECWSKFYLRSCCAVCNFVLYCTAIYRESIVFYRWCWTFYFTK